MKKIKIFIIFAIFLLVCGGVSANAEDSASGIGLPDEYIYFIDGLPDEVRDELPEGFLSSDPTEVSDAVSDMSGIEFLIDEILSVLGVSLDRCLPALATVCGLLLISAVGERVCSTFGSGVGKYFSVCSRFCIFSALLSSGIVSLESLQSYFDSLCNTVSLFIPLSGALYAIGGNVTAAASSGAGLTLTLAACEFIFSYTVMPIFCICLCFSLISILEPSSGFSGIGGAVKKCYTTLLSFLMMILSASLASQTFISAKADNAAMRGARFAASSFIPVTGGSVASSLGTVASSVELIRSSVGLGAVIVIFLMLLPVIIELAVMRLIYGATSFLAGILGCDGEKKLLDELGSLYGYLEGVAVICSVVFIIAFAHLALCASALS